MRSPPLAPPVAMTIVRFAVLKAALRLAGFTRTWRWIRTHAHNRDGTTSSSAAEVARAEYAVAMAAALYPGRAACLERSLMLYWLLRRAGVEVRLRTGVQMYPFLAHAWIEYEHVAINDVPEHVRLFTPIEGMGT